MTWATFYLVCFVAGFVLSVLSLLSGFGKLHLGRLHLPRGLAHHGAAGHTAVGGHGAGKAGQGTRASFFDFTTLMAFLSWFGGTGYLLTRYTSLWAALALLLASLSGIAGAGLVFLFLVKVLLAHEAVMDPGEYSVVGALGRVNSSIRARGTGEIIFSMGGTRHTCGARSEDAAPIARGTEVVITRYEGGIAYVRRWEDLAGTDNT